MESETLCTIARGLGFETSERLKSWATNKGIYFIESINMSEEKLKESIENATSRDKQDAEQICLSYLVARMMPF